MDTADLVSALRRERDTALRRLSEFAAVSTEIAQSRGDADGDDEHDPEGSTVAWERAAAEAGVGGVRAHLAEIDAALARIEAGWEGECVRCGSLIAAERLAARPSANMCVRCAAARR